MNDTLFTLLAIAMLLTLVSLLVPAAERLRLPHTLLLASAGLGLGFLGVWLYSRRDLGAHACALDGFDAPAVQRDPRIRPLRGARELVGGSEHGHARRAWHAGREWLVPRVIHRRHVVARPRLRRVEGGDPPAAGTAEDPAVKAGLLVKPTVEPFTLAVPPK